MADTQQRISLRGFRQNWRNQNRNDAKTFSEMIENRVQ
jgi:hypothetical protein